MNIYYGGVLFSIEFLTLALTMVGYFIIFVLWTHLFVALLFCNIHFLICIKLQRISPDKIKKGGGTSRCAFKFSKKQKEGSKDTKHLLVDSICGTLVVKQEEKQEDFEPIEVLFKHIMDFPLGACKFVW